MSSIHEPAFVGRLLTARPDGVARTVRAARAIVVGLVLSILASPGLAVAQQAIAPDDRLSWSIYRELVTLPWYGVFDHLAFEVGDGGMVTLQGAVRRGSLKDDAEARVKEIEGVEQVRNEIELLPPSPGDDRIRLAVYRAIYRHDSLERYGLNAVPSIHIIVKNGHITLEGIVANKMDKQLAEVQARSIPGTFSITNNLQVES